MLTWSAQVNCIGSRRQVYELLMEDPHGEVWSEVALFIIITPSNGWTNRSCEPEPLYTPSTIDQEKFEELGGGHPACRVRIQL